VQETLLGFSHAGDEVAWRGKYDSGAHASASPGVLKISAVVSGRHVEDILDRPRVANAFAQPTAGFYDRITINVAGASFGQDALIHGSILPLGIFSQVYDNLKGPADGYPLTPRGIFAFDLGASQFQSTAITGSANDLGRVNLNVQYNQQGFAGYRVQTAVRSTETSPFESVAGDPFGAPFDFVIRFKSGVPFYLQAVANMSLSLEMTTFGPKVQPVGSISDLHGLFGDSLYWNGFSDAKIAGVTRAFTVSSASGVNWAASLAPDGDADGIGDFSDRCPRYASTDQTDTDSDGRGNACECTDQNGDGRNTVADLVAINQAIFNPALLTPLCDGNNDGLCSVADIVAANAEIFSPTSTSICARQPVAGP
jgi:hypothetical protein